MAIRSPHEVAKNQERLTNGSRSDRHPGRFFAADPAGGFLPSTFAPVGQTRPPSRNQRHSAVPHGIVGPGERRNPPFNCFCKRASTTISSVSWMASTTNPNGPVIGLENDNVNVPRLRP